MSLIGWLNLFIANTFNDRQRWILSKTTICAGPQAHQKNATFGTGDDFDVFTPGT